MWSKMRQEQETVQIYIYKHDIYNIGYKHVGVWVRICIFVYVCVCLYVGQEYLGQT